MKYEEPFEWTPQSEAWVEAAGWIAEEKRARLRDDPIEEAFAKIKGILRKAEGRSREALIEAMGRALDAITPQDAQSSLTPRIPITGATIVTIAVVYHLHWFGPSG